MTLRTRTEFIQPKDVVQLTATFKDQSGNPIDADSFPQITIVAPSGLVSVGPTSAGVSKLSTGKYQFDYEIGFSPGAYGVWSDIWRATINGFTVEATFNFVVHMTETPQLNTDGYWHLGDDIGYNFSQTEIFNINKLIKTLRARLNSRGKAKAKDAAGNVIYVDCDIFSVDTLVAFLANSITLFNEIPHFTFFTFEDTQFLNQFHDVIVEGAVIWALASHSLISRGSEYNISDQGVNFTPPSVSELENTQFSTLLTLHNEKVKFIKNSFKPNPMGLGSFNMLAGSPAFRKLRHLRQKQIIG